MLPNNGTGARGQAPVLPRKTVTAQHVAKATVHYPKWERAVDAALWGRGEIAIKPTLALAASVFGVSIPLVVEAGRRLDERRDGNGNGAVALSDAVVERMVAEIGVDRIWAAIDKLTQPQLPLQAAE
jgi:hypothetical protein